MVDKPKVIELSQEDGFVISKNIRLLKNFIDMSENEKYKFIINNTKLLETTFNKDGIINNLTSQLVVCND
jgi:hypothetical protein